MHRPIHHNKKMIPLQMLIKPGFPKWHSGKESPANAGDTEVKVQSLGQEDPLEEEMTTHSSIIAWKIT